MRLSRSVFARSLLLLLPRCLSPRFVAPCIHADWPDEVFSRRRIAKPHIVTLILAPTLVLNRAQSITAGQSQLRERECSVGQSSRSEHTPKVHRTRVNQALRADYSP